MFKRIITVLNFKLIRAKKTLNLFSIKQYLEICYSRLHFYYLSTFFAHKLILGNIILWNTLTSSFSTFSFWSLLNTQILLLEEWNRFFFSLDDSSSVFVRMLSFAWPMLFLLERASDIHILCLFLKFIDFKSIRDFSCFSLFIDPFYIWYW